MGRLYGLLIREMGDKEHDPGYSAVVGACAFMGGSGRILMFLASMMLEVTNDLTLVPPLVLALFIAQTVGNLFNHGLYHSLISVQSLPYLTAEYDYLDHQDDKLSDIMFTDFPTFYTHTTCEEAWLQLYGKFDKDNDDKLTPQELAENGAVRNYPVVREDGTFAGMVTIDDLRNTGTLKRRESRAGTPLGDVMEESTIIAKPHWLLSYGYSVFQRLGLRHMVVVDDEHKPVGLVTRLTLMPWWQELKNPEAHGHEHGHGGHPPKSKEPPSDGVEMTNTNNPLTDGKKTPTLQV